MKQESQQQHFFPRCLMFIIGIFLMTFAIALSCKADLGTSPISSVPWVLSMLTPFSVGTLTIIMNIIFIAAQPLILRSIYPRELIGQIITTLAFGYGIDFSMYLLNWFTPENLTEKVLACFLSIIILGSGVFLEIRAKIFLVAGEGAVSVLSFVTHKNFSLIKNCFDITLVAISIAISILGFGVLKGIGIGTIAAAILVGRTVHLIEKHIHFFDRWQVRA